MAWANQSKNTTTFTNQALGSQPLTWDEALFTWNQAIGTWDNPFSWVNGVKSTTSFTNQTKN